MNWMKAGMEAVADVAAAVGRLRVALGERCALANGLAQEVAKLNGGMLMMAMGVTEEPQLRLAAAADKPPKRTGRPKGSKKAKGGGPLPTPEGCSDASRMLRREQKPSSAGEADKPPERKMGVCVICGASYLRKGPAQKCCSPECLEKKRAGLDKDGQPLKG